MIKFGSTYVFSLIQAISRFYTISKAFQTLKTLIYFDCPVSSQQKIVTHFGVLRYIASF